VGVGTFRFFLIKDAIKTFLSTSLFTIFFLSMDDMNIGSRIGGSQNANQWKSYSLQRGTAPVGTEVSPPQIPSQQQQQQQQATPPNGQNAIYASTNFENADGTLVIRRQMLNRYFFLVRFFFY
jgi:hypothetical protein